MIPIDRSGFVKEGPLKGWWVTVQEYQAPRGFLVSRSLGPSMDQTLILDGIFPGREALEAFFREQAHAVEWEGTAPGLR